MDALRLAGGSGIWKECYEVDREMQSVRKMFSKEETVITTLKNEGTNEPVRKDKNSLINLYPWTFGH